MIRFEPLPLTGLTQRIKRGSAVLAGYMTVQIFAQGLGVLAGFIMCPILTVVANAVGLTGGWIIALTQLRVPSGIYWSSVVKGLYIQDVWMGIIKPFFLGFVIVTIGCHVGLRTTGGTQGVGRATTNAVVAASVTVLVVDFFVTRLLISIFF